ncbi:MAG: HD domain-containing protein [archaeon]|nr:HD domain-containing protein [archaeon]
MNTKNDIEKYAEKKLEDQLIAGTDHFRRVYSNAKKIAKKASINYDDIILHAACYLHDIEQEEPHAEKSAIEAEKILNSLSFPKEKIHLVQKAIMSHLPESKPIHKEGVLLHDADLIEFLGTVGLTRVSIASREWFKAKDMATVLDTLKRYRKLYDNLILKESKNFAKNKTIVMDLFIKQLEEELK